MSADQAAASAQTAKNAAASAQINANNAARSALTATKASQRARTDAESAQWAKQDARWSANAAGQDAADANSAAQEASASYVARVNQQQVADRDTTPGSGPNGTSTANDTHRYWNCLTSIDVALGSPDVCVDGFKAFGEVMLNPAKCDLPSSRDSLGCQMYSQFKQFVDDSSDLMWDVAQLALGLCGLIPGVGEVCDGLDMAISAYRGDWGGAGLSLLAMVPAVGAAAGTAKVARLTDRLRASIKLIQDGLKQACSFEGSTPVLMADGSTRSIETVNVGDKVTASNPITGEQAVKSVTHVFVHEDTLIDLRLKDGALIGTTEDHPFWSVTSGRFTPAQDLIPGDLLETADGEVRSVDGLLTDTSRIGLAYNLSVDGFHTYHVGEDQLLVHNKCGEEVLDQFEHFEQARNKALDLLGPIDPVSRAPYYGRLEELRRARTTRSSASPPASTESSSASEWTTTRSRVHTSMSR